MNKKVLFVIIGISLLILGAISYALLMPKQTTAPSATNSTTQEPAAQEEVPETPALRGGTYTEYTKDAVLATSGTKLLFFHASWCPQCREIEKSIKENGVPNGVTVFKIDYDSNQALRQQYGVTLQTTFVKVDDQGNKTASYVAYDEPQFSSVERALLK